MAITLHREERTSAEYTDLCSVREQILTAAKAAEEAGRHDKIEVVIPGYRHTVTEPLVFSTKENPELSSLDITLRGAYPGAAEINSLVRLNGKDFTKAEGKEFFTYQFEKAKGKPYPRFRELFLNFHRIPTAKSPVWRNLDPLTEEERQGINLREGFWAPMDIAKKVAKSDIGATELVIYIEWVYTILHVKKVDLKKTRVENGVTYALVVLKEGEMEFFCRNCARHTLKGREMFFQNSPAYLEENTFAYDATKGKLYLDPENKEYMQYHAVEYPALENLLIIDGVDNFTIDGIGFAGATACFPCDHPVYTYQANRVASLYEKGKEGRFTTAAILASGVRGLTVKNCVFRGLGVYGVKIADDSYRTTLTDNVFEWISMAAVSIGNSIVNGWKNPKNRTYGARIENNIFKNIGYEYPASPCIYIAQVDGLKILHNTIDSCAYSGVSVGWGWDPGSFELGENCNIRNAEIAYNYIYNYMDCLRDGGAIYVVGGNCDRHSCGQRFNSMHDNFAAVTVSGTVGGKYGYYCDGAASNWEVRDSVVLNTDGMPIFSQPHPQALSYHNTFKNIYSTTQRHESTHVPLRDIITEDYHLVEDGPDALFAKYPEAKAIRDAAGAKK